MKTNRIFSIFNRTISIVTLSVIMLPVLAGLESEAQIGAKKVEVILDPINKQNISGYIHIAFAWGDRLSPPQHLLRGFINLKEAMHRYTKIETKIDKHLYLSSPNLLKMPFVYISTDRAFDLSTLEIKNVRKYFDSGGFMVLENAKPSTERSQAEASLRQMLRDTLGAHARFAPIPISHPLYHCFFDFDDGPPLGAELLNGYFDSLRGSYLPKQTIYLEGIWYKGRLVAIYSDKGYIVRWNEMSNNEPHLKMGVNMVVFALTQRGGIALKE